MDDSPHSTSARTTLSTSVFELRTDFLHEHGSIAVKVLSNIARIISRRMRHANSITANSASQYTSGSTRSEHDLLGNRDVPGEAYYGIQTMRATENFNISGVTLNFFSGIY